MSGLEGITRIKGPTIRLVSGRYFDFEDPEASDFGISDIAHGLSHLCRFTGHTVRFYSVAEHSVHCSHLVPPGDALSALLHDAPEAFLGDVSRPLKSLLPDYRAIERRVERAILPRFGIGILPPSVKVADMQMLRAEQVQAMRSSEQWTDLEGVNMPEVQLRFWDPVDARIAFLDRFAELIRA